MNQTDATVLTGLLGLIGSVIAAVISSQKRKKRLKKALNQTKFHQEREKNTTLLVGMGRTGKTQFVSYFTKSEPKPEQVTNDFSVFRCLRKYEDKTITYYINDYRGQNFGQLINSFIREQFKPHTVIRYGDINSLVLVVDLFPFEIYENDPTKQFPQIDKIRIQEHIQAWNPFALDAVFALLEKNSLEYVCLFINKIDKLKGGLNKTREGEIKKLYKPLIDTLNNRASRSTADFDVIIGSAFNGMNMSGVDGLESKLNKYSVPRPKKLT